MSRTKSTFAARRRRPAVGMIPLLSTLLIVLTILLVRTPAYLEATSDSHLRLCRTNMRTIASAEQSYRRHGPTGAYTADLRTLVRCGELTFLPYCPSGGRYRVVVGPGRTRDGRRVPAERIAVEDPAFTAHGSFLPGSDPR